jgi:hypothetical protein
MNRASFKPLGVAYLALALLSQACTAWVDQGSFQRSEQTRLIVNSTHKSDLFVNNRLVGNSDATVPLDYTQRINKKSRDVNYWVTEPGWSLFLTLISIGLYLPFSLIPVDSETQLTPTGEFSGNEFDIAIEAPGYSRWSQHLSCRGELSKSLSAILVPVR